MKIILIQPYNCDYSHTIEAFSQVFEENQVLLLKQRVKGIMSLRDLVVELRIQLLEESEEIGNDNILVTEGLFSSLAIEWTRLFPNDFKKTVFINGVFINYLAWHQILRAIFKIKAWNYFKQNWKLVLVTNALYNLNSLVLYSKSDEIFNPQGSVLYAQKKQYLSIPYPSKSHFLMKKQALWVANQIYTWSQHV